MSNQSVRPFRIEIASEVLADLKQRLKNTRWTYQIEGSGWDAGADLDYIMELAGYWQNNFDWRAQEAILNQSSHFKTEIDGIDIHFIHERGKGPNPFPLLLIHGFPDSFYRFHKLIPLLTEQGFDVVVPDLPGYGFSGRPPELTTVFQDHEILAQLMQRLGYEKYGVHGGDWGSTVTEQLARSHQDAVVAIHLTDVPFGHGLKKPDDLTTEEEKYFARTAEWMQKDGAYAMIQSTKPQSLAQGLNDSPTGLAAWIVEKFRAWSDCDGDIETRFTKDELLTQIMIYWAAETIGPSFLTYYGFANAGPMTWIAEGMKNWIGARKVPAAFALFPKDISQPPREWAERFFGVQRWTEMPQGGHFAAMEEPQLLAEDLRIWFSAFRTESTMPANRAELY